MEDDRSLNMLGGNVKVRGRQQIFRLRNVPQAMLLVVTDVELVSSAGEMCHKSMLFDV